MLTQIVIDKTTKEVKRFGKCDMSFDPETEEVIEKNFKFNPAITKENSLFWTYNDGEDTFNYDFLGANKFRRKAVVDKKTEFLIELHGFEYDSEVFSLTKEDRQNWIGLKTMVTLMSWPKSVTTKDGGEYMLAEEDLDACVGIGLAVVNSYSDSGRALKIEINACTTQAELDAIVDERT